MSGPEDDSHNQHALQLLPSQQPPQWIAVHGPNGGRRPRAARPGVPRPRAGLDPIDYKNHKLTLDCLDYYNNFVCPDMVLLDTTANPLRVPLEFWRYIPDVVLDMLVSTSLTHQLIRAKAHEVSTIGMEGNSLVPIKRHRMSALQGPSVPVIYKVAVWGLGARYHHNAHACRDTTICVWRLAGAPGSSLAIIAQRGGFNRLATMEDVYVGEGLVNFMLVDIMNSVMTPTWLMDERTATQTEYIAHLHTIYKDGRDSDFPCPATLLEAIIRINDVRALSRDEDQDEAELDRVSGQIFTSIASFNAADWTRTHVRTLLSPGVLTTSSPSSDDTARDSSDEQLHSESRDVADKGLDDAVAAVHDMCTDLTKTIQSALDMLLAALHRLWDVEAKGKDWCGKLSFWPLFIAGMEMDPGPETQAERDFVCADLAQDGGGGCSGRQRFSWDERLVMPGIRGLYFF
ncbi:hypothetical protein ACCO45_012604 [Purpureocillium lilacinum]|uniref:Uncharacterized protein n=1 Tax=Purpureocillium lilacinum TaxID=33203 RepID=A0ACC4DB09_PURLI